jgi:hypothetical protein
LADGCPLHVDGCARPFLLAPALVLSIGMLVGLWLQHFALQLSPVHAGYSKLHGRIPAQLDCVSADSKKKDEHRARNVRSIFVTEQYPSSVLPRSTLAGRFGLAATCPTETSLSSSPDTNQALLPS